MTTKTFYGYTKIELMLINRHFKWIQSFLNYEEFPLEYFVDLALCFCGYFCSVIPKEELSESEF